MFRHLYIGGCQLVGFDRTQSVPEVAVLIEICRQYLLEAVWTKDGGVGYDAHVIQRQFVDGRRMVWYDYGINIQPQKSIVVRAILNSQVINSLRTYRPDKSC